MTVRFPTGGDTEGGQSLVGTSAAQQGQSDRYLEKGKGRETADQYGNCRLEVTW